MVKIKDKLKIIIVKMLNWIAKTSAGRVIHKILLQQAMHTTKTVNHNGTKLIFTTPNTLNDYRADSFASKEPETLDWIDSFDKGSIFWDVGANVGLYSCYAAVKSSCEVIAFEPSVFNLELLARNISHNYLIDKVSIMPLAISDKQDLNRLNLSTTEWGGALSTFGETYGQDGKELDIAFSFSTFGISLDMALDIFDLEPPKYLKIDVDGIEHLILKGGLAVLSHVHEVLVEINDGFLEQSDVSCRILQEAGFKMTRTGDYVYLDDTHTDRIRNQIWTK